MSLSYKWTILIGKKNKEIIEMKQKKIFHKNDDNVYKIYSIFVENWNLNFKLNYMKLKYTNF